MERILVVLPLALCLTAATAFGEPNGGGEAARFILEVHCGNCHREDSPRAMARALAIFNLNQRDFAATMSDAQLENAVWRLDALRARSAADAAANARDFAIFGGAASAAEVEQLQAWVRTELRRRKP